MRLLQKKGLKSERFIIPEIVGFICAGLMVYFGKAKKEIK